MEKLNIIITWYLVPFFLFARIHYRHLLHPLAATKITISALTSFKTLITSSSKTLLTETNSELLTVQIPQISLQMSPFPSPIFALTLLLILISFSDRRANCTTFTLLNNCGDTIWPGILSNSGSPLLEPTGFALLPATSTSLSAPTGWSGRFWARTACSSDSSGRLACATGDCGSGSIECNGAAASPPTTLAEFTLSSSGGNDFYDVSLVDGYNLPILVEIAGGTGGCEATGCAVDLNPMCPAELRVGGGGGCRSACEAFGKEEYCCSGEFGSPAACRPSVYSQMFKSVCPTAYSYAYDDASSTFTCAGGDFSITFCPGTSRSQKASKASPSPPSDEAATTTTTTTEVVVTEDSWFASLAMGDSVAYSVRRKASIFTVTLTFSAILCVLLL